MTDREIIMAERPPEPPSSPHWFAQFSDGAVFDVPDSVPQNQVVAEAERQHSQYGGKGKFGYAFHVPSNRMIHGCLTQGEVPFLFVP